MDIVAMIMAWGLQVGEHEQVVGWVMRELFEEELISNMDALLEWAHPGWAFDFSEGYEDEEEGREKGVFPFVNWPYKQLDRMLTQKSITGLGTLLKM